MYVCMFVCMYVCTYECMYMTCLEMPSCTSSLSLSLSEFHSPWCSRQGADGHYFGGCAIRQCKPYTTHMSVRCW